LELFAITSVFQSVHRTRVQTSRETGFLFAFVFRVIEKMKKRGRMRICWSVRRSLQKKKLRFGGICGCYLF